MNWTLQVTVCDSAALRGRLIRITKNNRAIARDKTSEFRMFVERDYFLGCV